MEADGAARSPPKGEIRRSRKRRDFTTVAKPLLHPIPASKVLNASTMKATKAHKSWCLPKLASGDFLRDPFVSLVVDGLFVSI